MNYYLLSLIMYIYYFHMKYKRVMHMYQQNRYHYDTYINWIKNSFKEVFISTDILFLLFVIFNLINYKISAILFFAIYFILIKLYKNNGYDKQVKKPLVITPRVKRMFATTYSILIIVFIFTITTFNSNYISIYYLIFGFLNYISYFLIILANALNIPIEKCVFLYYKKKAIKVLNKNRAMQVIGITGSYGKTSSKNILNDILNIKFNSFKTPKNFNTTYGLINTLNNYLDKFNDFFIAEMGACRVGEIKDICDLVKPKYGIITKIGSAHLETFLNIENIQKTKFELVESLPSDGIAILNGDDDLQKCYKLKNRVKTLWIGIDNKNVDLLATDIKLSYNGTKFSCVFKGDKKKYKFETKLLGKANIYNILAAILLGKELGISIDQLITAVKRVSAVEHRLQLKKINDMYIIDDAYNSNPIGSKMALDTLSMMPGKKIIITPGMIELGNKQYELNEEFGKYMKGKTDIVILIGKEQTKPIYDGLLKSKFKMKNVYVLNSINEAFTLLNELKDKETYVLLENDLPDLFSERSKK